MAVGRTDHHCGGRLKKSVLPGKNHAVRCGPQKTSLDRGSSGRIAGGDFQMMRSPEEGPLNTKKALAEGSLLARTDALSYPIPGRLNVFLVVIQVSAAFAVLAAASHAARLLGSALLGVVFAFV